MKCPYCNKKINETSKFCEHCGKEIPHQETGLSSILIALFLFFCFYKCSSSDIANTNQTVADYSEKDIADISFVYEFIASNTNILEEYCKSQGYVPTHYVSSFGKSFQKTIEKFMPLAEGYLNNQNQEFKKNVEKNIYNQIDKDFQANEYVFENKETAKSDYCKIYDESADILIKEKIRAFKEIKPKLFLD